MRRIVLVVNGLCALLALPGAGFAQEAAEPAPAAPAAAPDLPASVTRGVEILLSMQESPGKAAQPQEWPYEGVYRVGGEIPIGYRVGGTGICATALLRAPGYAGDANRAASVERATRFIVAGIDEPLMSFEDYDAGYDVRAWGYCYGLAFLLELKQRGAVPDGLGGDVERAAAFYLKGLHAVEIPQAGGWNYARPPGRDRVCPPSSFMTANVLQTLFAAAAAGYDVNGDAVERGLKVIQRARGESGAVQYSGEAGGRRSDGVPGATGRMLACESTLVLAGRGSAQHVRGALDAFIVHWDWLNQRRAQPGTHARPYGVAPYYFYYAHYHAAQAVELLPDRERAEYRRRINDLLFSVRQEDGSWNDRVFARSANYGTAMAMMAVMMPETPRPAGWAAPAPEATE